LLFSRQYPDFRLSMDPHQDLSVTRDGRLIVLPGRDQIVPGIHGITLERDGLHAEELRRQVETRCRRRLLDIDPSEYRYRYRAADSRGPAQYLDVWTTITVDQWGHVDIEVDTDGGVAWLEDLAWSTRPTERMIQAAETASGNKCTVRRKME
jgi:hypothetical protein